MVKKNLLLKTSPSSGPTHLKIQGGFFNWASPENVSRLAPPINPLIGPPLNLLSMRITKHLDFFRSLGGASLGLYRFFEISYLPANT